jgi:LasA protease
MKIRYSTKQLSLIIFLFLFALSCSQTRIIDPTPFSPTSSPTQTPTEPPIPNGFVEYITQSGDTLPVVAAHFGVEIAHILSENGLPYTTLLDVGTQLLIPDLLGETTPSDLLFPDASVVFSPEAIGFDIQAFADEQGGHLSTYTELMTRGTTPGSEVIKQLALENSINPRILVALIESESGWVRGTPETSEQSLYPFGYIRSDRGGMYQQTGWAIRKLTEGYYGWRSGTLTDITFPDGTSLRLSPFLNAGSVAVLNFFAGLHDHAEWLDIAYGKNGIAAIYSELFDDPWERAVGIDPLFPTGIEQPELVLPFPVNQKWNLTGGPHSAWGRYGPRAALDFAPPLDSPGCGNSVHWTTAAAPGRVVRVGSGLVALDLDQDGYEQTGWVLIYMHVANSNKVGLDAFLQIDDIIGHPSCEGGSSSGIHIHIARKYNGEWVLADGGLPFVMSGYQAANGEKPCDYAYYGYCAGTLTNGEKTVIADPYGNYWTAIFRPESDPKYTNTPTPKP